MKLILLLALCSWSCLGETVDKLVFEDWMNVEISEVYGKIVWTPRLIYVLVDSTGQYSETDKLTWSNLILN